jgi:hypothetical protein
MAISSSILENCVTEIKLLKTSTAVMAVLLLTISSSALLNSANGQRSPCDNGIIVRSTRSLPLILVQGYENSDVV